MDSRLNCVIQTLTDALGAVKAGSVEKLIRTTNARLRGGAAAQRQRMEDSGRAGPVGPALRISHAGREGALLASARQ